MRTVLIFLLLFSRIIFAQDCELNSFKNKREFKKINKLIQNKDFFQANSLLKNTDEHPVFTALKAELAWLEGNILKLKIYLMKFVFMRDIFPFLLYVGEIAYQQRILFCS